MPATVAALYRYPVKGFTPETCEALTVRADGRIEGDRVLGVRFADTPEADDQWAAKPGMLVLMNTPALARLRLSFDQVGQGLTMTLDGAPFVSVALDEAGRAHLADVLASYASCLDENPLRDRPERLPLRIVGDGVTPRYHDSQAGNVSVHSRASLQAVAGAFGDRTFDEVRFRSNIVLEGLEPWEELAWAERRVRIGEVEFEGVKPMVRCLATHANPTTGQRDRQVMTTLTHAFQQEKPTFAVSLRPLSGGMVRLGDSVTAL